MKTTHKIYCPENLGLGKIKSTNGIYTPALSWVKLGLEKGKLFFRNMQDIQLRCPGPGRSWGNLASLPASKDAESPSLMFHSIQSMSTSLLCFLVFFAVW